MPQRAKPLTENQHRLLQSMLAGGSVRPKAKDNFVVRSLERKGFITRTDYNDCRITDDGRLAIEAQKLGEAAN